ncbi:MAG: ABC transporter ATP-binding protein [Calditrichaceae bacterium]|nr:ABC transporter ATP-binding protein [Calditrichaceae bacterium]
MFSKDNEPIEAIDNINLNIYKSESLGIIGESGSGKSTLGRSIIRLIEPDSGSVLYDEREILDMPKKQFQNLRKKFQMIYQNPGQSLNPLQSVKGCIGEPLKVEEKLEGEQLDSMLRELAHSVGLDEEHLKRFPHQLSGGEKQKVVIARALANNPTFIVADEPTSNLDAGAKKQILDLLVKLKNRLSITILLISHDISVIRYATDRIAVMLNGCIVELGPTEDVVRNPQHPYTQYLINMAKNAELSSAENTINTTDKKCGFIKECSFINHACQNEIPGLVEVTEGWFVACHNHKKTITSTEEISVPNFNVAI